MSKPSKARAAKPAPKLTPKQLAFIDEYLVDLNATQAAIRAGYSEATAYSIGEENLKKPEIAAAIRAAMDARAERTHVMQDRVIEELKAIGFAKITDLVSFKSYDLAALQAKLAEAGEEWDEDGEEGVSAGADPMSLWFTDVRFKDSADLPDNIARAIQSVSKDKQGRLKLSMHDKKSALIALGRHLGMFDMKARLNDTADGGVEVVIQRFGK